MEEERRESCGSWQPSKNASENRMIDKQEKTIQIDLLARARRVINFSNMKRNLELLHYSIASLVQLPLGLDLARLGDRFRAPIQT